MKAYAGVDNYGFRAITVAFNGGYLQTVYGRNQIQFAPHFFPQETIPQEVTEGDTEIEVEDTFASNLYLMYQLHAKISLMACGILPVSVAHQSDVVYQRLYADQGVRKE